VHNASQAGVSFYLTNKAINPFIMVEPKFNPAVTYVTQMKQYTLRQGGVILPNWMKQSNYSRSE
jgi:hypothetical protein